jgi:hypothetical protein
MEAVKKIRDEMAHCGWRKTKKGTAMAVTVPSLKADKIEHPVRASDVWTAIEKLRSAGGDLVGHLQAFGYMANWNSERWPFL